MTTTDTTITLKMRPARKAFRWGYSRNGALHFLALGRLRFTFCIAKGR